MLIDMTSSASFRTTLEYIGLKEDAEISRKACNGIFLEDNKDDLVNEAVKLMTAVSRRSQKVQKPVLHISINPHPEDWDKVENRVPELVQDFTEAMGLERCQRLAVVHNDAESPGYGTRHHIHVAYNKIPYEGSSIGIRAAKSWKRNREKTLDCLTEKYNLEHKPTIPARRRNTTGQEKRYREETQLYEIGERETPPELSAIQSTQDLIERAVNENRTLTEFLNYLQQHQCHTRITTKDNKILGISYENEGVTFKGSYLGRDSMASTLKGLTNRGISIDIERDAEAIARRALDKKNPQRKVKAKDLIQEKKNYRLNAGPKSQSKQQPQQKSQQKPSPKPSQSKRRPKSKGFQL